MKRIPDSEWFRLFDRHDRERNQKEREAFLRAMEESRQDLSPDVSEVRTDESPSGRLERRLPYQRSVPVDDTLDLHQKRVHEARQLVASFLQACVTEGDRQVLIICGKGHHSERPGVLREQVRLWLKRDFPGMVAWFSRAPRSLGGEGAYVVRLHSSSFAG